VRLGAVALSDQGSVYWSEGRPAEGGRSVIVCQGADGARQDVIPAGFSARTRVHEYGGGAWALLDDGGVVFANQDDQRLYLVFPSDGDEEDATPLPLTAEPEIPQGERYADLIASPDATEVYCVREKDVGTEHEVSRELVAVALDGSMRVRTLVQDGHFLSNPRPSPDAHHLSWLTWDHPQMPWDGTELRVAELKADGSVGEPRTVLGGREESIFQPEWAGADALYAVSDRTGWWNLYEVSLTGEALSLCPRDEEFGNPQWVFGMARYAILGDGRLAVTHGRGMWTLSLLDPATGDLVALIGPEIGASRLEEGTQTVTDFEPAMSARGETVATICGGPAMPLSVVTFDVASDRLNVVKSSVEALPPLAYLPEVRQETFGGPRGRDVHAFVYPPRNPDYVAPPGEKPPFVTFVHGGPTAQASTVLDMQVAYFTSRGIGVVDVNYGGSTGYGRQYRNRLRGEWGVVDVEDVVAAATGLAELGEADPRRLAIRGSSAGGWTVLVALTRTRAFGAGASYYGVADLLALAEDTHDFEAHYTDGLVGPLPAARHLYVERSPLSHVEELESPILLLQGAQDKVVPPNQAELFATAMRRRGTPHAHLLFEGEQHGFRRAETLETAIEAELSFYGQVLGFEPVEVPVLTLVRAGA
jgi:dipeptidyl aminopeptidase/acylaminoacyl peptidase